MTLLYAFLFLLSSVMLAVAGDQLVRSLARIARFFGWQEFIAAFFVMSVAVSVPEFFIGVTSALQGIPELSFGNIIGANIVHFTLAIALATIVLGKLEFASEHIRMSVNFTILFSLLPLLLMIDNDLSRIDGIILIAAYFIHVLWVFSKREHFARFYETNIYNGFHGITLGERFGQLTRDFGTFAGGVALLLVSAFGMVRSASFFAETFSIPLVVVGVFVVGLGTALPETYFAVASARRGNAWMVIGNLLGATVLTASFVLGVVALIHPISITDFSPYIVARTFLVMAAAALLVFTRTGNVISSREASVLLMLYVLFAVTQLMGQCCVA